MGWSKSRIGDVIEDRVEQGLPEEREFTYIDISAVDNRLKEIVEPKTLPTAKAPSRARQQVRHGDVLVSTTRPNLNAVALVPPQLEGAVASTGFAVLRPVLLEPRWLYSVVQSEHFVNEMSALVKGALYPAIRPSHVHDHVMPIPPLAEQKRITNKLTKLLKRVRNVGETLKTLPELIQQYRAAVLEAACTGRLVPTEAELARKEHRDFELAAVLLERILVERRAKWETDQLAKMRAAGKEPKDDAWKSKYPVPQDAASAGFSIPKSWSATSLDSILAEALRNGHSAKATKTAHGVRTFTLSAVTEGDFSEKNTKLTHAKPEHVEDLWAQPGDIYVERSNTPQLVGTARLYNGPRQFAIIPDLFIRVRTTNLVIPRFVEACLLAEPSRDYFRGKAQGTAGNMPKIDQMVVQRAMIPLPPLAEQKRIVDELQHRLSAIEAVERQAISAVEHARQLRAALFHKAVSGGLVAQSPNDESAAELLKRIAAIKEERAREQRKSKPKHRMKKSKRGETVPLAEELLSIVEKEFGGRSFTFAQLAPHLSADYESVKIEIFNLLTAKKGQRLKQLFNPRGGHMELQQVAS
jgi:type I restriction enzyme, S subunit